MYCNITKDKINQKKDVDLLEIKSLVKSINSGNVKGITLSGGEPLEFEHLEYLVKNLNVNFGIITSGISISKKEYLYLKNIKKLKFITFSIDALDEKIVKKIRGKNILEEQLKSLHKVLEWSSVNVNVNVVCTKLNYMHIIPLFKYLLECDVKYIQFFDLLNSGDSNYDKRNKLNIDEKETLLNEIFETYTKFNKNSEVEVKFLNKSYDKEGITINRFSCSLSNCVVHIESDLIINQCKFANDYNKIKFTELNIDDFVQYINEKRDEILQYSYNRYIPCKNCIDLKKSCIPCILYGKKYSDNIIKFSECMQYEN